MKATSWIKIIGLASMAIGLLETLLTDWANEKQLKETVAEEVARALSAGKKES
ncbi:MAG: hypothetical protein RR475_02505 [Clostridia bacterium]